MMKTADPTMVFLGLAGILYLLAVGAVLKRHGFREWAVGLLVLYFVVSFLLTLGQVFSRLNQFASLNFGFLSGDVLARVLLYGVSLLSLLFLHLNRSFLRLEGAGWGWWALGVAWIAVAVVLNENLLPLPEALWGANGWTVHDHPLGLGILVSGWGVFMGGATLLTARAYRRTQQPLHRNRITCWFLALGLTVAGDALLFAGRELLGGGLHLLGALSVAYLVLAYRLPDVRQMARRAVSYLAITLLTVVIYTAGFLVTQHVFQSAPGYSPLAVGAVVALILATLFDPLLKLVQRLVDRLISGTSYDPSSTLREYSMSISNILDLERLAMVAVGLIGEAVGIQRGALFVVHYEKREDGGEDGSGYFRLRAVRGLEKNPPSGDLSFESPVANYLRLKQRPLTQYDIDLLPRFRKTAPAERAWLASLDMDVFVPIYAKGEWIGLLALGPKVSGDRYFDDDLIMLSTLADQTAVALENARLFDDLRIQNAENERLNKELAAANRELARLDQAKSDFIDIASHELRTPLTQVYGYNDLLGGAIRGGSLTPEAGLRWTQGVRKAGTRLKEIVDLMLDVSRLDTETLALDVSLIPLARVVNAAVDVWATSLEERKQSLTVEGLGELPPITADGERLKQVFSHLIQNAIKYTPDGGHIRITGHLLYEGLPPQDQTVAVIVADTGIGIAPDDLERIFEKFYRVGDITSHSTGKIKFKGAGPGLGLTIARGIVEAHGGRLWVESSGHDEQICPGSEFHVVLPVQPRRLEPAGAALRAGTDRAEG